MKIWIQLLLLALAGTVFSAPNTATPATQATQATPATQGTSVPQGAPASQATPVSPTSQNTQAPQDTKAPHATRAPGSNGFITKQGTNFVKDGCPFYFHGANAYYLHYRSLDLIRSTLDAAFAKNITVIRSWAFLDEAISSDNGVQVRYQSFDDGDAPAVNQDSTTGLGALDRFVAEAKARGMKLILALTNNWGEYGGMDKYNMMYGSEYHDGFYNTNSRQFTAYKTYVSTLLNRVNHITGIRYSDEPTIFAWELANEPRCHSTHGTQGGMSSSGSCSAQIITNWINEASRYIKTIDGNHLVAVGDEGFGLNVRDEFKNGLSSESQWPFRNTEGIDAEANLRLESIDFGTFHLYPHEWIGGSHPDEVRHFTTNYINYQASLAQAVNKPVLLEEYGSTLAGTEKQEYFTFVQDAVARNPNIAGSMFWAFATNNSIISGDHRVVTPTEISPLMGNHINAMQAKNANCPATTQSPQ
ncbi:glycoside hydrolase superfamily [Paraphysoderma sedebokerense]|nr:glycoside hydrolase superfamily [Paraphysoderma sedebokerense]